MDDFVEELFDNDIITFNSMSYSQKISLNNNEGED